jgi:Cof subfamily protein (haloacid dehalogenase superfamily)
MLPEDKMAKNLLILDIDKTLKPHGKPIPKIIVAELERLTQDGNIIMLATGRSMYDTSFIEKDIGNINHYSVYLNGSITVQHENNTPTMLRSETFNGKKVYDSIKQSLPHHYGISDVYQFPPKFSGYVQKHVESFYTEAKGYNTVETMEEVMKEDTLTKLSLISHDSHEAKTLGEIVSKEYGHIVESHVYDGRIVEIGAAGVNKATGVKPVFEKYVNNVERVIIVGDNYNDIGLFTWGNKVGAETYAMANAVPSLKQVAKYETGDVNREGALHLLQSL